MSQHYFSIDIVVYSRSFLLKGEKKKKQILILIIGFSTIPEITLFRKVVKQYHLKKHKKIYEDDVRLFSSNHALRLQNNLLLHSPSTFKMSIHYYTVHQPLRCQFMSYLFLYT